MSIRKQFHKQLLSLSIVSTLLFGGELALAQSNDSAQSATAISASEPTILQQTVAGSALNTTISLPATKDTYVASNRPGVNYGGSDTLLLGYNALGANAGALRILLQFDFHGSIPSRAVINSAKIRLRMYSSTGGGMNSQLRHLNSGWDEFAVTWSSHEPDWGGIDTQIGIGTSPGWVEWDITSLAKQWINGSEANDGVIILGDEFPGEHQRAFWSRNAGGGEHPQLIVDYSDSIPDTRPPTSRFKHPMNQYQLGSTFLVEWEGDDHSGGSGIDYYDVQFREAGQDWQNWLLHTGETRRDFNGQNGKTYEFRVRAVDKAHNVEEYPNDPQARTTVDTTPPVVNIVPLAQFQRLPTFNISWSGSDPESGISHYDIQFTHNGQPWQEWLNNLTQTTVQSTIANGVPVQFRVRAADKAGNASAWEAPNAVTGTTVDTLPPTPCSLAIIPTGGTANTYRVTWSAVDNPNGSGIGSFTVRYRHNGGTLQTVVQQSTATSANVTLTQGDGTYAFELLIVDVVGNQSTSTNAVIIGSTTPTPQNNIIHLPIVGAHREGC